MGAIVNSGAAYIAAKIAAVETVDIADFVLANISGLVDTDPVDPAEVLPAGGDIVYTGAVTQSGYVSADKVVYSLLLGSSIGDFDFNWIGLRAADGTLIAVAYSPLIQKRQTVVGLTGNNISRNFLVQFADAQSATNVTIDAATWQIDFTGWLNSLDNHERESNFDIYGDQAFFDEGYEVWNDGGTFKLKAGLGYVDGIRINNETEQTIVPGALPKDVWLDVSLQGDLNGIDADVQLVFDNAAQADYVDGQNRQHYLERIASIDAGGAVTDLRNQYAITNGLLAYLTDLISQQLTQSEADVLYSSGDVKTTVLTAGSYLAWAPDSKTKSIKFTLLGGGGGGGSTDGSGNTTAVISEAGSAGATCIKWVAKAVIGTSYNIQIGLGGAGGTGGNGSGGANGVGSTLVSTPPLINMFAGGGTGGNGRIGSTGGLQENGNGGGASSGGDLDIRGGKSTYARTVAVGSDGTIIAASASGDSFLGAGGITNGSADGEDSPSYGGGGGACFSNDTFSDFSGGAGGSGVCIIEEYF
jgi:hypothetical protein